MTFEGVQVRGPEGAVRREPGVQLPERPGFEPVAALLRGRPGCPDARPAPPPRALATLLRIARPVIAELGDGIVDAVAASRPDAILLSTVVAPLGYQVAEAAGVPWAGVFLQPVAPTGDFGSVLLGGRSLGRRL